MNFAESKPANMAPPEIPERIGEQQTSQSTDENVDPTKKDGKGKKRSLFSLGKKKSDKEESQATTSTTMTSPKSLSRDTSKLSSIGRSAATSPSQSDNQFMLPSSPGRGGLSSSPRLSSPAGSQIFERDVQESAATMPTSPAIPSHITTEDQIPPVLDASSEAITDSHLDPDSVEIVTHNAHLPAAVTVTGASPHPSSYEAMAASWAEELGMPPDVGGGATPQQRDDASSYGALDAGDVRRLSFISFADVVQAEHSQHNPAGSRESMHLAGLTSLTSVRSPSPMRSPVSSQGGGPGTSPPTSKSGSVKGLEMSPVRKPVVGNISPPSGHHGLGASDINIETMSQALRRTGSADLSHARSPPTSPVDGAPTRQF